MAVDFCAWGMLDSAFAEMAEHLMAVLEKCQIVFCIFCSKNRALRKFFKYTKVTYILGISEAAAA